MNASLPAGSHPLGGLTKAERLEELTDPYGPDFPLDEDILADLAGYPGELPTSPEHYVALLPDAALSPEEEAAVRLRYPDLFPPTDPQV